MATRKQILDNDNNEILPITDTDAVRNPQSIGGTLESRLQNIEEDIENNQESIENNNLLVEQSSLTDQQRNTALANVSNQTANSTTGKMGYKVLDSTKTFAEQVTAENTIYEIRDVFDLNGGSVTIPGGCILKFNGGLLSNGILLGNITRIEADRKDVLNNININGSIKGIYSIAPVEIDNTNTAQLGQELVTDVWTLGANWSGDVANGFAHSSGSTEPITTDIPSLVAGDVYAVSIVITNANEGGFSDFKVTLGGSASFETYKGGGDEVQYNYGIVVGSENTSLVLTPRSAWVGTVKSVSVKHLENSTNQDLILKSGNVHKLNSLVIGNSLYIGKGYSYAFWGYGNTAVGINSMDAVTGGFWNTSIGRQSLENINNGSRNVAIGYISLQHCVSGHRNIAIGTFALNGLTSGARNIAIGSDALQTANNTDNIAIGIRAGTGVTSATKLIAIGSNAGAANDVSTENIFIGYDAGTKVTGSNKIQNTIVGHNAMHNTTGGLGNTGFGYGALQKVTGNYNVAIGYNAGNNLEYGSNNIIIGKNTYAPSKTTSNCIVLGNNTHTSVRIAGKIITFNEGGTITWTDPA